MLPNGVELILISKPKARSIRVSLDRVRRCPREIVESDNAGEVPVSDLFEDPDAEEETETHSDVTDAPALVEAEADEQREQLPVRRSERLKSQAVITRM